MTWSCKFCDVDGLTWEQYAEHAYLEHGKLIMPKDRAGVVT